MATRENHWLDGAKTLLKKYTGINYLYISTGAGFFLSINGVSPLPGWWFHFFFSPLFGEDSHFD